MSNMATLRSFALRASTGLWLAGASFSAAQQEWAPGEQAIYQAAQKLVEVGRPAEAVPLGEQRLALAQKHFGESSDAAATATVALANYCVEAGDARRARELFTRAMAMDRKIHGSDDGWILVSLRGLGKLESIEGNYTAALPLLTRALKASERIFGKEDTMTAMAVEGLAQMYARKLDNKSALPLFERVLRIRQKVQGKESTGVATALLNLSIAQRGLGQLNEAESSITRAVAMYEKLAGPEHPFIAVALKQLGQFYRDLHDYEKAVPALERALAIQEKVHGPDHPSTIIALHGLGVMRASQRRYDLAESLLRRALTAAEKTLGKDHIMTAKIGGTLGNTLSHRGDHEQSIVLLRQGLDSLEKKLGADSPEVFETLNNLALALNAAGKAADAEPLLRRALAVAVKTRGPESEDAFTSTSNLVWCLHALRRDDEARHLAGRSVELSCHRWEELLTFASEAQLENAWITVWPWGVGESLGDASLAATVALRFKDSLASSLLENRRRIQAAGKGSSAGKLAAAAGNARARLRDLVQQGAPAAEREKALTAADEAEKGLARKVSGLGTARRALHITPTEVGAVLPQGAVLVEFSSHVVHGAKSTPGEKVAGAYSAILIAAGREPQLVALGPSRELEAKIEATLKLIQNPPSGVTGSPLDAQTEKSVKELHAAIMVPIEAALPPETKTLVLSPDSDLHFVPFAALMDVSGRFTGDKYTIRYVTNGRDLLTPPKPLRKSKAVLLVGNPDYAKSVSKSVASSDPALAEVGRALSFDALPGTVIEIESIKHQFEEQKWKVRTLSGATATEPALMSMEAPAVLHLATHGFFLNPVHTRHVLSGLQNSPYAGSMANSGLPLAGADSTVREWAQGRVPSPAADGILTAAEAVSLPLEGTTLVTLSACETGLGLNMPGGGVAGLKRALTLAGAQHLLTTLWPVADEETAVLMKAFYSAFLSGDDPGASLAKTQREFLTRWRQEHGLWFALNRAAPFILTATTRWKE